MKSMTVIMSNGLRHKVKKYPEIESAEMFKFNAGDGYCISKPFSPLDSSRICITTEKVILNRHQIVSEEKLNPWTIPNAPDENNYTAKVTVTKKGAFFSDTKWEVKYFDYLGKEFNI